MVRHQAIRVKRAAPSPAEVCEVRQVDEAVVLMAEARLAVIAALPDVNGDIRHDEARMSRHHRHNGRRPSAVDARPIITTLAPNYSALAPETFTTSCQRATSSRS